MLNMDQSYNHHGIHEEMLVRISPNILTRPFLTHMAY